MVKAQAAQNSLVDELRRTWSAACVPTHPQLFAGEENDLDVRVLQGRRLDQAQVGETLSGLDSKYEKSRRGDSSLCVILSGERSTWFSDR